MDVIPHHIIHLFSQLSKGGLVVSSDFHAPDVERHRQEVKLVHCLHVKAIDPGKKQQKIPALVRNILFCSQCTQVPGGAFVGTSYCVADVGVFNQWFTLCSPCSQQGVLAICELTSLAGS